MSFIDRFGIEAKKVLVFKKVSRCILLGILPAALFYSIALFWLRYSGFMIMEILRDPAQQSGESSFLGFLSNIGIWLWVSSVEGFAFLVAGSFLALSILTDLLQSYSPLSYTYTQVFEEGFKFIGAATWLYFNARMASFQLSPD